MQFYCTTVISLLRAQTILVEQEGFSTELTLRNSQPIRQQTRGMPTFQKDEARRLVQEMPDKDSIQRPWASPVVLIKKDGSTQFRINYRRVKAVTRKDAYLLK